MGTHAFSFAIYPHKGTFAESDVPIVAAAFNMPMQCESMLNLELIIVRSISVVDRQNIAAVAERSPISLGGAPNVILETIKRGEDDEADGTFCVILRMFEQYGGHARATLKLYVSFTMPCSIRQYSPLLPVHLSPSRRISRMN
jgi:alpha-mannosidase